MNRQARRELLAAFHTSRVGCKAVVLTGSGDSFCSGVDLREARADADACTPPDPRSDWIEALLAIREHPAIFGAAVNGFALGGGATLISMYDLAIAADQAEIGMPEIGFGAYPQFSGPAAHSTDGQTRRLAGSDRGTQLMAARRRRGGWSTVRSRGTGSWLKPS
jgi:enoyl-CoA hydratase/carnithine racemase